MTKRTQQIPPRADLAEMIAAVMQHPEIPPDLYNHIGEYIVSYGEPQVHEVDRIRRTLDAVRREKGARR